jgi:hypothetical protein
MANRSINDVAASLRSVRLYLEPVVIQVGKVADQGDAVSLGVPFYKFPSEMARGARQASDCAPGWFRVLGREGAINCKSTVFIYAELPPLTPAPVCELDNAGYLDFPEKAEVAFVRFDWGDDLLKQAVPAAKSHSCLSVQNISGITLWLVWSGDANSTDRVPHRGVSKHCGGSIFAANFLITVFHDNNGSIGAKVGNAAITVHGFDAGELVVRGNFLFLVTATDAIKIGLLIIGADSRRTAMTSFARDIRPLFRDVDVAHMKDYGLDLSDYQQVKDQAQAILDRVSSTDDGFRMPPPPDAPWTRSQIDLFRQWMTDSYPA